MKSMNVHSPCLNADTRIKRTARLAAVNDARLGRGEMLTTNETGVSVNCTGKLLEFQNNNN